MKAHKIIDLMSVTRILSIVILIIMTHVTHAQDDLDALLDDLQKETIEYVSGTFKSTRVINLHSVEMVAPTNLDFRISHRFGALDGGAYEFFGLDQATMRLAFEYGVTRWLNIGIGRSTYGKTVDGFIKAKIIRQTKGKRIMPFSVVYLASATINGLKWEDPDQTNYFSSRMAYAHQLIIASKVHRMFSLQISPTIIHKNLVASAADKNTSFALGFSGRVKLSNRITVNAEYIYRIPPKEITPTFEANYNSLSVGFDIETGGHVFSLHFSNSAPMFETGFVSETGKAWKKGGVHFGFNISRMFLLKKENKTL